ncbi:sugar lactone lactonase YvrE [Altererythrobacter atlanticus]|uniref:L-arabinolactonase n=1 Tax=Croceibacterium atlanticum TaxID=1267766 RepID=A0A0F7KVI5_9SPHN|nr:SMP-30/gluconolactonase/LRE family protein [Croceibacterium atlanticum]AKH43247.1 L-arabinolactonase [Croceibacterium atlanticum]MBB5732047.1 sugar lactone lactonase YvrE [Croceibacterium atlanticum]
MEITPQVRTLMRADCLLGEGVIWDPARAAIWFVDIKRHQLWNYDPETGGNLCVEAPGQIGWALPAEDGLLLCGLQDGLYTFDPGSRQFAKLADIPGEPAHNRLNDACTDPGGRVWFGSMDDDEKQASGRFYVFDRGEIRPAGPSGITITNGPAVSPQGDRIYFTDTGAQKIMVADLRAGIAGDARPFVNTGALFPDAYPDGPIVDEEDHLWTGLYLGGRVARFDPDGWLAGTWAMPARDITKMALGGRTMKTAYVTTATKNMAERDFADWPEAGSLLSFDAPVAGVAQAQVKLG